MDDILDYKNFPALTSTLINPTVRQRIRLLSVFGCDGQNVVYATNEDIVYGFGCNRFGALGLSTDEEVIDRPQLNYTLTGEHVIDFFAGREHWMALTADGRCYGWGHNQFGQLGLSSLRSTDTPHLIELTNEQVIRISCGDYHTLVLTVDGQVLPLH